jgi:hypothetical protein
MEDLFRIIEAGALVEELVVIVVGLRHHDRHGEDDKDPHFYNLLVQKIQTLLFR